MTGDQLVQRLRDNMESTFKTCEQKTREYAKGDDPFITIRRLAMVNGITPAEQCMKQTLKQYLSLYYDINDLAIAEIRDKINDIHIYLEYAEVLKNDQTRFP